jgi:hypothetical protein
MSHIHSVIDGTDYSPSCHYIFAIHALLAGECEKTQAGNLLAGIESGDISYCYILDRYLVTLSEIERVAERTLGTPIE